ncbi:acetyl-CoA carboxylase biotin carboxyl carrier protein [Phytoactinopolyspora mesophila]|uniref:acetyl-CoA carboxylase biotin carboxyl carrier protein n=1 Tax=Phytoactinopolyspora mesophila TaxID=2650750 RepID=UPI001C9E45E3
MTIELDWRASPAEAGLSVAHVAAPQTATQALTPPSHPLEGAESGAGEPAAAPAVDADDRQYHVCAPSVGTFYQSPEPGAAPFVSVGNTVTAGQQVGIVEVMKLMIPVEVERAGRVIDVLVDDGHAVEHGQRLVALAPLDD